MPPQPPPSEPELPATSTQSNPTGDSSRIAVLEADVEALKARLTAHDTLLQQITQYSELQSELIQRHEMLIFRLMKRELAQGETSCREDELRHK